MLHSSDGSDENENRKRWIAVERHSDVGYHFGVGPGFQGVVGKHDDRGRTSLPGDRSRDDQKGHQATAIRARAGSSSIAVTGLICTPIFVVCGRTPKTRMNHTQRQ
jgi:hypothetical protein